MPSRAAWGQTLLVIGLILLIGGLLVANSLMSRPTIAVEETPLPYAHPRGYVCHRASGPITIDGKLDEAAWDAVPWSEPFVDVEGDVRPAPRFHTRVKMLWDDHCLYIAAELDEPHVWATLKQHDSVIFHDNDFEVFLDPDGDSHLRRVREGRPLPGRGARGTRL